MVYNFHFQTGNCPSPYRFTLCPFIHQFKHQETDFFWTQSCLENPMNGGAWWAAVHGVAESDTIERLHFHFSLSCIGGGNGNHSSVLAWRVPGTGEPGGLPSMGSHSRTRLKRLSSSSSNKLPCALATRFSRCSTRLEGRMGKGSGYLLPGSLPPRLWFSNRWVLYSKTSAALGRSSFSYSYFFWIPLLLPPIAHSGLGSFDLCLSHVILDTLVPACLPPTHPKLEHRVTVLQIKDTNTRVGLQQLSSSSLPEGIFLQRI